MTRTAGVPSLRRVLTVTPVLIVSLFVLLLAAQAFSETRRFSDIIALARIADEDNGLSPDLLTKTVEGLQPVIAEKICRSDIIKAGMRLVLADIDAHAGDASPETDAMRLGFAETYMRHALSCLPANGDVWLRLAMVRSLRNASAMEIAVLTNFSQLYGPADANLIRGRFVIWQQFTKGALPQAEAAREADTAIVCGRQGEILRWSLRHVCSQELQTGMQSAKPRP
ncbi:hypothetical protein QE372_003427 [Agrobacterium pusense]|jgi:hypothetical protein|uniref:Uncharacterized protein n=1 Tax=Agrobacterium pusense TaxID=648995 RepID=U4Q2X3_9HYPH|nr:hypothetical protein [Agrobacterium pusense]MBM7325978.1 hypothetical protein [Agrobacterium sp. S2]MBN8931199.1 hypothetical protein [Agrobacterium pusense]MDR6191112.1 hypothetical protein [Agrobacterium pusense]WFN88023.1 hypothetical protein P9K39_16375 [Agrobacterium pusense]CDI10358.1 conserved exported protein of unknown function [Agrobacterium pusense]